MLGAILERIERENILVGFRSIPNVVLCSLIRMVKWERQHSRLFRVLYSPAMQRLITGSKYSQFYEFINFIDTGFRFETWYPSL